VVSVSRASGASLPPTNADYTRGASVTTTGNNDINIQNGYFQGIDFKCGTGANTPTLTWALATSRHVELDDCSLQLLATARRLRSSDLVELCTFPASRPLRRTQDDLLGDRADHPAHQLAPSWNGTTRRRARNGGTMPDESVHLPRTRPPCGCGCTAWTSRAVNGTLYTNSVFCNVEMWDCKLHASVTLPTNKRVWDPLSLPFASRQL
jgi:hypothetical protein